VLTRQGWPASLPSAVVLAASTPRQRVWRGQLSQLAEVPLDARRDGPGVIVIGDVAAIAEADAVIDHVVAIA
jgi:siroheme synthase